MLKKRIIPTLLYKDVGLVKGLNFNCNRRVGTTLPVIKIYNKRDVDEIILLDVTATNKKNDPDYDAVTEFAKECSVPLTVGGGINKEYHISNLLKSGADKISINTAALIDPELISYSSKKYGRQCIVVSIDVKKNDKGDYICYTNSGTEKSSIDPIFYSKEMERLGAGELLITSIDKDGTMQGYDHEILKIISNEVRIPVIASGGAGKLDDFSNILLNSNVSAVAAASVFHFSEITPSEIRNHLRNKGLNVRKVW